MEKERRKKGNEVNRVRKGSKAWKKEERNMWKGGELDEKEKRILFSFSLFNWKDSASKKIGGIQSKENRKGKKGNQKKSTNKVT